MGGGRKSTPAPPPPVMLRSSVREMEQDTPMTVETEGEGIRRKRRGKRALIAQPAAANVGGEGTSGLQIPKG
jgi:hypothetical protein